MPYDDHAGQVPDVASVVLVDQADDLHEPVLDPPCPAIGPTLGAGCTAGSPPRLRHLGAEQVYDYWTNDPADLGRFDVILDPVGRGMRPFRRLFTRRGRMAALTLSGPG